MCLFSQNYRKYTTLQWNSSDNVKNENAAFIHSVNLVFYCMRNVVEMAEVDADAYCVKAVTVLILLSPASSFVTQHFTL